MPPLASVIVPTIGRDTLRRTLRGLRSAAGPADLEIIVVGDAHGTLFAGPLAAVPALCLRYGAYYYDHDGGQHCVGHPQREFGMTVARGRWLLFSQDDALWTPDAWPQIRLTLETSGGPCVFRVQTWQAGLIWRTPELALGNVDADGFAVPNRPERLGRWGLRYEGDYDFLRETAAHWPALHWAEPIIAYGRPAPAEDWTVARG